MRPIFVTGTGTDVGKTHILCAMLEAHRRAGGKARVLKPVISGFDPAQLNATDTIRLMRANGAEFGDIALGTFNRLSLREGLLNVERKTFELSITPK